MSVLLEVTCRHVDCLALGAVAVLAQQNGFGYALVGGAVRDAYHNRTATDHDIAVWGHSSVMDIQDIMDGLDELGYLQTTYHDNDPNYNADAADGRYECIIEYSHPAYPCVDILVFSSEYGQLSDVLNSFDYNINQFGITLDDVSKSEQQTAYFGGDQLYQLRKLRGSSVTEERAERITNLARDYGWKIPEEACSQLTLPL